jgi:toxin ParE1/3/4
VSRTVEWAQTALTDLIAQVEYIAADNPEAAERVAVTIRVTGDALGEFATGHPGRVAGTYEKSVPRLPYIIAYALTDSDKVVSVLRVVHTARNWSENQWPS